MCIYKGIVRFNELVKVPYSTGVGTVREVRGAKYYMAKYYMSGSTDVICEHSTYLTGEIEYMKVYAAGVKGAYNGMLIDILSDMPPYVTISKYVYAGDLLWMKALGKIDTSSSLMTTMYVKPEDRDRVIDRLIV